VPPPRCLLEQGIEENIGMERGKGRVVIFFFYPKQTTDRNQKDGQTTHSLYEHRGNDAKLQKE
jgi:hypothetical protein